jgi:hypothetical protein
VFDDSIFEWTITGDGFRSCPYPPGTTVSVRLLPRGADIPAGQRGGNILGLRPGHVDRAAAIALVPSVRASYERTTPGAPDRDRVR